VGVTGHRPNNLSGADSEQLQVLIDQILETISHEALDLHKAATGLFSSSSPLLRLISPLAEGADRMVAREALDKGYTLQCPLPFPGVEYEKDFVSAASRTEFRSLLDRAEAVFELDGTRERTGEAYLAAGRLLLCQSDVLIALWNGKTRPENKGGTGQVVREAEAHGIPVLWIDTSPPHQVNLYSSAQQEQTPWRKSLRQALEAVLLPPESENVRGHGSAGRHSVEREAYFSEIWPRYKSGLAYTFFRDYLAGEDRQPLSIRHPSFTEQVAANVQAAHLPACPGSPSLLEQVQTAFIRPFVWADILADHYAGLYRSSFITCYLFSGLAVFFALIGYAAGLSHKSQQIPVIVELLLILSIIGLIVYGKYRKWHERWMDYRLLAERLRQAKCLAPLGTAPVFFPHPPHHERIRVQNSWVNWYFRAILRETGLITARLNRASLSEYHDVLKSEIRNQIGYHKKNANRCRTISHRLHRLGLLLFMATFAACALHLMMHGEAGRWLTLLTAVLPAFGAAVAGIRFQGEFERLADRSEAMQEKLAGIEVELAALTDFSSGGLQNIALDAAHVMQAEALDWQFLFQARPLTLPA
jgi:hypothetical protein